MSKIQVTLDAQKLRNLVTKRNYKNKDGQDVELQEVKFELVPVKEPKTIFTKDNMRIDKTHFACVIQTKEERNAKAPTIYIGEGFSTIWLNDIPVYQAVEVKENPDDDLPF
jgi:hypothetical protein